MKPEACCVLNAGGGAWAFEALARRLADDLWVDVSDAPRAYNYLLAADDPDPAGESESFVPLAAVRLAADKRLQGRVFAAHATPTPETHLLDTLDDAHRLRAANHGREWCVKFPTACGGSGHRLLIPDLTLPASWPRPLVVQEFVRLARPEVYRTYAAGGELFGWVVRRFPEGSKPSPWVAHARGARYEPAGEPPAAATAAARSALVVTGLLDSFGCADLLPAPAGGWLVLEVGTDGPSSHVDRDLGIPALEREIRRRVAEAFWARAGTPPWGGGPWRPRTEAR
ncbi:MAG TPA: hypothetical protein VD866_04705 [Urbifossiella sp.]|nr:hypothetical protein [Urbifossiella sp.]